MPCSFMADSPVASGEAVAAVAGDRPPSRGDPGLQCSVGTSGGPVRGNYSISCNTQLGKTVQGTEVGSSTASPEAGSSYASNQAVLLPRQEWLSSGLVAALEAELALRLCDPAQRRPEVSEDQPADDAALGTEGAATSSWSLGSAGHPWSCALPCKFVMRTRSCKDGVQCTRCHLCKWTKGSERRKRADLRKVEANQQLRKTPTASSTPRALSSDSTVGNLRPPGDSGS
eukprot:TRINITY_DN123676_c0_g1_i1.p1 TRINITY_DN123676_c0_g1~~TRINITY_DN123676_c0_g1_i1.p1  ORF type:complete len:229 (+),score=22.37 TRINITY_DN123676_c0_g1_i1:90-776(+)